MGTKLAAIVGGSREILAENDQNAERATNPTFDCYCLFSSNDM